MRRSAVVRENPGIRFLSIGAASALAAVMLMGSLRSADAAIRCDGQFQIIKGASPQATSYCVDNYLAGIARGYGWRVSNVAVRNNPNLKARICRQIGFDSRLIGICAGLRDDADGRGLPF